MTFDGNQSKPNLGRPQHPVPLRAHPRRGRTSPKPAPTSASSRIFPSANSPKHSSVNRPITASPTAAFGRGSSAATASPAAAARPRMNYPPSSAQCATPLHGPPRDPKSSFAATRRLSSFGQIVMSRSAIVILACGAQPQAVARPRSCASAPSMPRSTVPKLSASPPRSSLRVWTYCYRSAVRLFGLATGDPITDRIREAAEASPTASPGIRSVVSSMATSAANASNAALEQLAAIGALAAYSEQTSGRRSTLWLAVRH